MHTDQDINEMIRSQASELGFEKCGFASAAPVKGVAYLEKWLEAGYAAGMNYIQDRLPAYQNPHLVLEEAESVIMLAYSYNNEARLEPKLGEGAVSRYAWGLDYHDVIRKHLHQLCDRICEAHPEAKTRGIVDTAPLLEREYAELAGLGWIGKNTMLIDRELGSWFFVAAVITDLKLEYSAPYLKNYCGTCRACIDACPTDAFVDLYTLDSNRCISYTTIEHRGPIEESMRIGHGDWLYGCDICQDVCPWNRKPVGNQREEFFPMENSNPMPIDDLFRLDENAFRKRFKKSPIWRTKRQGLLRNAAIVLGNQKDPKAIETLKLGLHESDPVIRGAVVWGLGQIGTEECLQLLNAILKTEQDSSVRKEIHCALNHIS